MSLTQIGYTAGKYSEGQLCCICSQRGGYWAGGGGWGEGGPLLLRFAHDGAASDDFTKHTGAKWHLERGNFSFKGALQKVRAASQVHGKGELP